ncbi:MAG: threonine--tRNA ligase [Candidatus Glassbacteria bacterium]
MIEIVLSQDKVIQIDESTTPSEILSSLRGQDTSGIVAALFDNQVIDLSRPIKSSGELKFVSIDEAGGIDILRHSASHVMAYAVKELYENVKIAIGPSIENGFYYDFLLERPFTPDDLAKIEDKMKEIVKSDYPFERLEVPLGEALEIFRGEGEDFKVEILSEIDQVKIVTLYRCGRFTDLCRGPHVPTTGYIKHFKLLSTGGAYWRGDERNPMLQRIYGTAFPTGEALSDHLRKLEEAAKRDHRKLGPSLDLFSIQEEGGSGLVYWHPKGALIRHVIETYWKEEHLRRGYDLVSSPHIARMNLWERSGHLDFYAENMYKPIDVDGVDYILKPMNCPFHILIYKSTMRSYRELPIRWAELGTVYRYERSGVLHGLMRVRGFTQDDAHIFCRPEQLDGEIRLLIDFATDFLRNFGFEAYEIYLSTRPQKYVGSLENWDKATSSLEDSLKKTGLPYTIDPQEGVFYGPKIDIKIKDAIGRTWQCTTIQVDFNEPERFDIRYVGKDGQPKQPIMIHRAIMGSLERFMGVLIEHYAGAFPTWLAPVQATVLPITDENNAYAERIMGRMREAGVRVSIDTRSEKIGYKIREAEVSKVPYMLIVGKKEEGSEMVSLRVRGEGDVGKMGIDGFIGKIQDEINKREIKLSVRPG